MIVDPFGRDCQAQRRPQWRLTGKTSYYQPVGDLVTVLQPGNPKLAFEGVYLSYRYEVTQDLIDQVDRHHRNPDNHGGE